MQLGLQIPIVLAGFRIPQKKVSQIPDSKRSNFPDSRIWITYTGQIYGLSMKKLKLMSSKILVQLPLSITGNEFITKVMFLIYLFLFLTEMNRIE